MSSTAIPSRPHGQRRLPALVGGLALVLALVGGCSSGGSDSAPVKLSAAGKRGQTVAKTRGCTACHSGESGGRGTGPTWKGLAGSEVKLDSGSTTADDAYLRRAIVDPRSEVVQGFPNIMPSYPNLSDAEVKDLIAYLHDLSPES